MFDILNRGRAGFLASIALASTLAAATFPACAQSGYPNKPIHLIVPFPPGGGGDKLARTLAPVLEDILRTKFVIDNRGGANGSIALQVVATSPADGYTLGLTLTDHIAVNPFVTEKLPYDPVKDLAPIGLVVATPYVFTVKADSDIRNLSQLLARAKKGPEPVSIGYPTVTPLIAAHLLERGTGAKFNMIPYRGLSQSMSDLMGGRLDVWVGTSVTMRSFVESGKLAAVGVTSAARSDIFPHVATVSESGVPGFDLVTWYGIVAPAGTPPAIVKQLNAALNAALKDKGVKEKLDADGAVVLAGPPEKMAAALKADMERFGPMIKQFGIKAD